MNQPEVRSDDIISGRLKIIPGIGAIRIWSDHFSQRIYLACMHRKFRPLVRKSNFERSLVSACKTTPVNKKKRMRYFFLSVFARYFEDKSREIQLTFALEEIKSIQSARLDTFLAFSRKMTENISLTPDNRRSS